MSDYSVQEKHEGCYRTLRKKSIFLNIGIILMVIGFAIAFLFTKDVEKDLNIAIIGMCVAGLGAILTIGPNLAAVLFGGGALAMLSGALRADYEVITTDGYGNKSSDGGSESMMINLFGKLIGFFIVLAFIPLVTGIQIFFLSIKGIILTIRARPPFFQSCLLLVLLNIAIFLGAIVASGEILFIGLEQQGIDTSELKEELFKLIQSIKPGSALQAE